MTLAYTEVPKWFWMIDAILWKHIETGYLSESVYI